METTQVAAAAAEIDVKNLPKIGTAMHAGKFAGVLTDDEGRAYVLVLLDVKAPKRMGWKAATAWAGEQGGVLPNRVESAQLFRALGDEFVKDWHWTSEAYGGSTAWIQNFGHGFQDTGHVDYVNCARAVRRFVL